MSSDSDDLEICGDDDADTDFAWSSASEDCPSEPDKILENSMSAKCQNKPKITKKRNEKLSCDKGEVLLESKNMIKLKSDFTLSRKKTKTETTKLKKEHEINQSVNDRVKQVNLRKSMRIRKLYNEDDENNISSFDISIDLKPLKHKKSKQGKLKQDDVTSEDLFKPKNKNCSASNHSLSQLAPTRRNVPRHTGVCSTNVSSCLRSRRPPDPSQQIVK